MSRTTQCKMLQTRFDSKYNRYMPSALYDILKYVINISVGTTTATSYTTKSTGNSGIQF
jgi:hypothetical protein